MAFIGTLVYLACIGLAVMMGYEANFNFVFLALLPLGILFGYVIRRGSQSSTIFRRKGFGVVIEVITFYITALITTGIAFGIGYGIMEILKHRPPG